VKHPDATAPLAYFCVLDNHGRQFSLWQQGKPHQEAAKAKDTQVTVRGLEQLQELIAMVRETGRYPSRNAASTSPLSGRWLCGCSAAARRPGRIVWRRPSGRGWTSWPAGNQGPASRRTRTAGTGGWSS
jgi:hypothetical protein